jgi:hypothetical protein
VEGKAEEEKEAQKEARKAKVGTRNWLRRVDRSLVLRLRQHYVIEKTDGVTPGIDLGPGLPAGSQGQGKLGRWYEYRPDER